MLAGGDLPHWFLVGLALGRITKPFRSRHCGCDRAAGEGRGEDGFGYGDGVNAFPEGNGLGVATEP
jgi:hypothetical protein